MLHIIADEFGCEWLYPLDISKKESVLKPWNQTKWIVLSSTFFSIPAVFFTQSVFTPTKTFSYMLIVTSLISANYWRNATRGWRRNLDLVVAKITFTYGFYIAITYLQSIYKRLPLIVIFCCFPFCYNGSTKCINAGDPAWVKYHFTFHVLLSICGAIILHSFVNTKDATLES